MADPGFPVGGRGPVRGHGPPTRALFSENVCENKRIGSRRGWRVPGMPPLDPPMCCVHSSLHILLYTMGFLMRKHRTESVQKRATVVRSLMHYFNIRVVEWEFVIILTHFGVDV